jgi:hypothetical protein
MNKLRLHFAIVVLCCFSFLLLAGRIAFRKTDVAFDVYKKPADKVKESHRLVNVKKFKKMDSHKNESLTIINGGIK